MNTMADGARERCVRAQFENWATSRSWSIKRHPYGLQRYCSCDTERMWEAFQAAAPPSPATCKPALQVQPSPAGQVHGEESCEEIEAELQFYREEALNLPNILIGAGVFSVDHEGDYKAAWANIITGIERLAARQPVAEVSGKSFNSDGTSNIITPSLPLGTKLYAAPHGDSK